MVNSKVWLVVIAAVLSDGSSMPDIVYIPRDEVDKAYEGAVMEFGFVRYAYECKLTGTVADITGVPLVESNHKKVDEP